MLLTVDIGNTNITLGVYDGDTLIFTSRLATEKRLTPDQYAVQMKSMFFMHSADLADVDGAIVSSVVPDITNRVSRAVAMITSCEPVVLTSDKGTGLKLNGKIIHGVGADLAAASIGAVNKYSLPCFVLDLGTATKIILLDENGVFVGCSIAPGVGISLDALSGGAALLPGIGMTTPDSSIGTETADCMRSGIVFGTAAMLDGMCERMEKDFGRKVPVTVATGGYSREIVKNCTRDIIYDENLVLDGLKKIFTEG